MALPKLSASDAGASARTKINAAIDAVDANTATITAEMATWRDAVAAEIASRQADVAAEAASRAAAVSDEAAARGAADAESAVAVRSRPGDTPASFTSSLAGGPGTQVPALASSLIAADDDGRVARVVGTAVIADRRLRILEPSRTYRARFVVRRRTNAVDPSDDAVRLAVAWYDQNKIRLAAPNDATIIQDLLTLTVGQGRQEASVLISRAGGPGILVPPVTARYARPYVQTYGDAAVTDIEVVGWADLSDAEVWSPDVSAFDGRVAALESLGLGPRVDELESANGSPNARVMTSKAALEAAHIPASVDVVQIWGYYAMGDGGRALYRRAAAEPSHPGKIQSADGAWWEIAEPALTVKMFGAKGDGVTDDSAAVAAAYAAVPDGGALLFPGGVYSGSFVFDRPRVAVLGAGSSATVLSGASATGDVVVFGKEAAETSAVRAQGFRVTASVQKTSGAGFHVIKLVRSSFHDVVADGQDGTGNLYDGFWWDRVDCVFVSHYQAYASNRPWMVNGAVGSGPKAGLYAIQGKISGRVKGATTGKGIVVGGAFGGFYLDQTDIIQVTDGVTVDRSLAAEANREIFMGPGVTIDTCSNDGLVLNDPAAVFVAFKGWAASCARRCVSLEALTNGVLDLNGAIIFPNKVGAGERVGVRIADATTQINFAGAVLRSGKIAINNVADNPNIFGVAAAQFYDNDTDVSSNVGIVRPSVPPGQGWLLNTTRRISIPGFNPPIHQIGGTAYQAGTLYQAWLNGSGGGSIQATKSRSAVPGTQAIVQDGDELFRMIIAGDDGTAFVRAAQMYWTVKGTPGANAMPARMGIATTAPGSSAPTERIGIEPDGSIGFGGTSYGGGSKVFFFPNCSAPPSSNPSGGGIFYVEGGALKYRGSSGTVTTIAPA